MIFVKFANDKAVEVTSETPAIDTRREWESRHDWKDSYRAEEVANAVSELTGDLYIAIDKGRGHYPRYDVIKAPAVGDKVSYAFNGDYYPDGEIVKISPTLKVVETDSGKRYYRRKNTGAWVNNKTWTLVPGHIDKRNPHF